MIRPLVFDNDFLHSYDATTQITRRFYPNLYQIGYRPYVLCNDLGDLDPKQYTTCNIQVVPFNHFAYFWTRSVRHSPWPYLLNTPDQFRYCWMNRATKTAEKMIMSGERFDFVHTVSMPGSQHLPGLELKKKYGLPWVAHFFDPWIGNTARELNNKKYKELDAGYERQVAEYADVIIHPCQAVADDWNKRYGGLVEGKLFVLPFIGEDKEHDTRSYSGHKLTISHIGNLRRDRNTFTFIESVGKAVSVNPGCRGKLAVNYVGNVTEEEKSLVKEKKLDDIFNFIGSVSEEECEKYYEISDIFLIVDLDCQPNFFYPSKLIKYFGYKKPILGICTKQSVIKDELQATGNHAFEYYDVDGVSEFIVNAMEDYFSICTNDTEHWKIFKTENVLREYDRIVRSKIHLDR